MFQQEKCLSNIIICQAPPPRAHLQLALKQPLVTTGCHSGPRATVPMPERGRGRRWVLPAPTHPSCNSGLSLSPGVQPSIMQWNNLNLLLTIYFFLPLPGESLQMCRKLSFPGYIPKCSYAISLRTSPHCPIQKFNCFLKEKEKCAHENYHKKSLISNQI